MTSNQRSRMAALILGVALLSYAHALTFPFVCDDVRYIERNPYLRQAGQWGLFFAPEYWDSLQPYQDVARRPLLALSLWCDGQIFGAHAAGYHLSNVLLHGLASLLVAWLGWELLGSRTAALCAGLLFASSAAHVEAVAWVKNRGELLAACLAAFALAAYVGKRPRLRLVRFFAALGAYWLSLSAKLTAAAWPLALAGYHWLLVKPRRWLWPTAAAAAVMVGAGCWLSATGAVGPASGGTESAQLLHSPLEHAVLVCASALTYVRMALFGEPAGLFPSASGAWSATSLCLAALAAALVFAALRATGERRQVAFWCLVFGVALVPVVNLRPLTSRAIALQRCYLASMAAAMLLAIGARRGRATICLALALTATSACLCVNRSFAYSSNGRLYDSTVRQAPGRAESYLLDANPHLRGGRLRRAILLLRQARRLPGHSPWVDYNLACAYLGLNMPARAIVAAGCAAARGLGVKARLLQGNCLERIGRPELAAQYYKLAATSQATAPMALNNLGNVYVKLKRLERAMKLYRLAIAADPTFVPPRISLGGVLLMTKQYAKAEAVLTDAARLAKHAPPATRAKAYANLALALEAQGRAVEARAARRKAMSEAWRISR